MHDCPQGVHASLRAYYHYKSADWTRNNPVPLKSFTATELAKMPTYYIMELHKGMAATVAPEMPSPAEIASCKWLTEQELSVYSGEYLRTGFQGGLNWYRCRTQNVDSAEDRTILRPADRSALALHRRKERLGHLSGTRQQWYYSTRQANPDMHDCPQGVHAFLRAYYHYKSADWTRNNPVPLKSFTATELAKMPTYYIMELHKGMAATVAPEMPSPAEIASCKWLTEQELSVYSGEYLRTGFQGGLNWYRCRTQNVDSAELELFSGRQIEVPSLFIAGRNDWGIYQVPGSIECMQDRACTRMRSPVLVDGAGHWVQQEQPEKVSEWLIEFLNEGDR